MPDRDQQPDFHYPRELTARDPLGVQLYVRALRNERVRAVVSAFLRFGWRHISQRPRAFTARRATEETKPASIARLANMFGPREHPSRDIRSHPRPEL